MELIVRMLGRAARWHVAIVVAMLALVVLPSLALAQNADPALGAPAGSGQLPTPQMFGLDGAVTAQIQSYATALQTVGMRIFVALAVLEFLIVMFGSIIQGRPVFEVLGAFVPKMVGFSFFYWLLVYNGWQATQNIIASFYQAGQGAGGVLPTSDSLVTQGATIAAPMVAYAIILAFIPNYWSFIVAFGYTNAFMPIIIVQLVGAAMVIGSFTILAGIVALTIVEAYLVSVVALIMSAFSALRFTPPYGGTKMLAFAVSIGVKLMILELCIGVVQTVLVPQITAYAAFPVIGALLAAVTSVMTLLIAYNASSFASGVVSGVAMSSASAAMSAVTSYINQAQAMAAGLQQTSDGIRDQGQLDKLNREEKSHSATDLSAIKHANQSVNQHSIPGAAATPLAGEHLPSASGVQEKGASSPRFADPNVGRQTASSFGRSGHVGPEPNGGGSSSNPVASGAPSPHTAGPDRDDKKTQFDHSMEDLRAMYYRRDHSSTPEERSKISKEIESANKDIQKELASRIGGGAWQFETGILAATKSGAVDAGVGAPQIRSSV